MMALLRGLFAPSGIALSAAGARDARAIAALHAASFARGWSDGEVERLLVEANVLADKATSDRRLVGFILTRTAADEAEILSIAVDKSMRGRGLGHRLLQRNLQRLAALGIRSVFLEVDAANASALALYERMRFSQVGRRDGYYPAGNAPASTALVLRREFD